MSPARTGTPLVSRIFPQRELLLRRSWTIGGYGRPLPKPIALDDDAPLGLPLVRVYQLREDQIVARPTGEEYQLREDQIAALTPPKPKRKRSTPRKGAAVAAATAALESGDAKIR